MSRYSYHKSLRDKKINKIVRGLIKFHLTHQNVVLLILGIIFSYLLVKNQILTGLVQSLSHFGVFSIFILGFFFSFGSLTIPASVALFILAKSLNPLVLALIATSGAITSNFIIFRFVKDDFMQEVKYVMANDMRLDVTKFEHQIHKLMFKSKFARTAIASLAGILISLPLPTSVIVSMLWTITKYDNRTVLLYSFIFNFVGLLNIAFFGNIA